MILKVALKSLKNRLLAVSLTGLCIAMSVVLLLTLQKIKSATEKGFTEAISQVDLLVGGRGGSLQLLLFSVFNVGQPYNNVSWSSYRHWKSHPAVDWTIPYSLGDSYKGFRVVATDDNFFTHYRFRQVQSLQMERGRKFQEGLEIVLGFEAYRQLELKVGDSAVITHGVTHGAGVIHHDEQPFKVVGILKQTGTTLDHSVYIPLSAMEELHHEAPSRHAQNVHEQHHKEGESHHTENEIKNITSFFVRAKSRTQILALQREISEYAAEPLSAVIPSMALAELWKNLSYFEKILQTIILMVAVFSWVTLMLMMLSNLDSRRREMALLRSMGASPSQITGLFMIEAFFIGLSGIVVGLVASRFGLVYFNAVLKESLSLQVHPFEFEILELWFLIIVLTGCLAVSLVPSWFANRRALKDGLMIKT